MLSPAPRQRPLGRAIRLIGLLLLAVLLVRIDLRQAAAILAEVHLLPLLLAIAANVPQLGLKAVRWWYLLRLQGVSYRPGRALLAYLASVYVGILTPGRLGEFVKALYVRQDTGVSVGEGMSSVLVDRLFDLYALIGAGTYGLVMFARLVTLPGWALALVGLGVLASLAALLPCTGRLALRALAALPLVRHQHGRLAAQVEGFYASLSRLASPRLLPAIAGTAVAHAILYAQCYLLALALDLPLRFGFVLFAMAAVNLVNLLPVTVSGLGTREATLTLLFGSVGLGPEVAVAYSALVFLTFYIAAGVAGAVAWTAAPLRPGAAQSTRSGSDRSR